MKVVVIVKNGVVAQVFTDDARVQVLVLDDETDGCDKDTQMDIGGVNVALDAMTKGLAKVNVAMVHGLFIDLEAALKDRQGNAYAESMRAALLA